MRAFVGIVAIALAACGARTAADASAKADAGATPAIDAGADPKAKNAETNADAGASGEAEREAARIRSAVADRFAEDKDAAALADELFTRFGSEAGVEVAHTMDGGYRGKIRIEPALPIGRERKHLAWVVSAMRDFEAFFAWLGVSPDARPYRYRTLSFRFMRSVGKRTPTAYAHDWTVAYNLNGSLLVSEDAARETLFHEIFHLNDGSRSYWSQRALGGLYDEVVAKCGTNAGCLAPYAPSETMVRNGTYYAFTPGNGVVEYAAELALRYYREQRAVKLGKPVKSFKCGPAQNGRAWVQLRDEFFGGIDRTPPCP